MSWGTKQGNAYDMVFAEGRYGNTPKPVTEMTLGEVVQFGKDVLIPGTKGKIGKVDKEGNPLGTSAVGAYQFTHGTLNDLAPKVLGENWQNTKFSPEVQEGLAKALYEQSKAGNLQARWEGVKNNKVGAYANVPWEQARLEILQAESKMPEGYTPNSTYASNQNRQTEIERVELPSNQIGLGYLAQKESELNALRGKLDVAEADREYYKSIIPKGGEEIGLAGMQIAMPNMVNTNVPVFDARKAIQAGNRQVYLG